MILYNSNNKISYIIQYNNTTVIKSGLAEGQNGEVHWKQAIELLLESSQSPQDHLLLTHQRLTYVKYILCSIVYSPI